MDDLTRALNELSKRHGMNEIERTLRRLIENPTRRNTTTTNNNNVALNDDPALARAFGPDVTLNGEHI